MARLVRRIIKPSAVFLSIKPIFPHLCFFWTRVICMGLVLSHFNNIKSGRSRAIPELFSDFIYLVQFNTFQYIISAGSLVKSNVFAYRTSIAAMSYNIVLSAKILISVNEILPIYYRVLFLVTTALFIVELVYSIYAVFSEERMLSFELFKKIGANPVINSAFAKRKCLESLGATDVFIVSSIVYKNMVFGMCSRRTRYFTCIQAMLTYATQLVAVAKVNEENMRQRRLALLLSFIKIALLVYIVFRVIFTDDESKGTDLSGYTFIILLVCSILYHYFLSVDTRMFGSGLKTYLSFKTSRICL